MDNGIAGTLVSVATLHSSVQSVLPILFTVRTVLRRREHRAWPALRRYLLRLGVLRSNGEARPTR